MCMQTHADIQHFCLRTFFIWTLNEDQVCDSTADNKRIELKIGLQRMWLSNYYCWASFSGLNRFSNFVANKMWPCCDGDDDSMLFQPTSGKATPTANQLVECQSQLDCEERHGGSIHSFTKCFRRSIGKELTTRKETENIRWGCLHLLCFLFFPLRSCQHFSLIGIIICMWHFGRKLIRNEMEFEVDQ